MGNRSFETQIKLNKNNVERQKKFSYDTNDLNQYLDRSIYVDIEEAVAETGTRELSEEPSEPFTITNKEGYYEFDNLDKGEYTIIEVPHKNWEIISPSTQNYSLYLNRSQKIKNLNFENIKNKKK